MNDIAGELTDLACELREIAGACDAIAMRVAPQPETGSLCDRYRAGAQAWPESPPPTYSQLAAILCALHDTAAAARMASRRAEVAVRAVAATAHQAPAARST